MKHLVSFLALYLFIFLASCNSNKGMMTGNDKDSHGCIGSAGYTWSVVQNNCIRVWESGVRLNNYINPQATTCTYVVFSTDSTLAEIFIPDLKTKPILKREGDKWSAKSYFLKNIQGKLSLYKDNLLIYQE